MVIKMQDYITKYISYLILKKQYSENTLESYKRDLFYFSEYLASKKITFENVTKLNISVYAANLARNGKSDATIARVISTLKGFYSYLYIKKVVKNDPSKGVTTPHVVRKNTEIITIEEMDLFLSQPDISTFKGSRDKAILEIIYATGIKVSELINLKVGDVNFITETIFAGNREIPYGSMCSASVNLYIKKSKFIDLKNKEGFFFTNLKGEQLSRQGVWKIIKYYKKMSGIEKDITQQTMRHSFAVHLIDNGIDIRTLQELMGHSSLASTQAYIDYSKRKIRNIYKSVHPRA